MNKILAKRIMKDKGKHSPEAVDGAEMYLKGIRKANGMVRAIKDTLKYPAAEALMGDHKQIRRALEKFLRRI